MQILQLLRMAPCLWTQADFYRMSTRAQATYVKGPPYMPRRHFEDLTEGEGLRCQPLMMTREAIIDFAEAFDPQPFHVDDNLAKASIFGGLVASSLHTLSACTRVVVEAQGDVAILSGVGMDEVKMYNPVRPGDTLTVEAWWADLKRSRTQPDRGFAAIKCKVTNQRREPIVEYGYRYLVACRDSA